MLLAKQVMPEQACEHSLDGLALRWRGYPAPDGFLALMLAPTVPKALALASPSAPLKTSMVQTSSTSSKPAFRMA